MVPEVLEHSTGTCSVHVEGLSVCYFVYGEKAERQADATRGAYTSEES